MPFKSTKRAKNQEYYKLHASDSAKKKYSLDRQHFINKSMQHTKSATIVNPVRVKKSVAGRVKGTP